MDQLVHVSVVVGHQSLDDLWTNIKTCEGDTPVTLRCNYKWIPSVTLKKALAKSVAPPLENVMVTVCELPENQ